MGLLMNAALAVVKVDPVQSAPLELGDGTFLLGAMGHVMRLDAATGDVLWKTPFAGGTFEFRQADARPGVVYVGAEEIEQTVAPTKRRSNACKRITKASASTTAPRSGNAPFVSRGQ